jgi:hypothetical protein
MHTPRAYGALLVEQFPGLLFPWLLRLWVLYSWLLDLELRKTAAN